MAVGPQALSCPDVFDRHARAHQLREVVELFCTVKGKCAEAVHPRGCAAGKCRRRRRLATRRSPRKQWQARARGRWRMRLVLRPARHTKEGSGREHPRPIALAGRAESPATQPASCPLLPTKSSTSSLAHRPVKHPSVAPSATANRPATSSAAKASSYSAESCPLRASQNVRERLGIAATHQQGLLPTLVPMSRNMTTEARSALKANPRAPSVRVVSWMRAWRSICGGKGLDMLNNRRA